MKLGLALLGALLGGAGGLLIGALLTLLNNTFLVPGGAATGSYRFWMGFFAVPGTILGLVIGALIAWRTRTP